VFNGPNGPNPQALSTGFQPVGADTQLLGNFEYRVPIFGPVSLAAFADIGSAFNLRNTQDQIFSSTFNADQPFLQTLGAGRNNLSVLAFAANPNLAINGPPIFGFELGLVARDNRLVTADELNSARGISPLDPNTLLPFGFQQVYLRGEAQTNTAVRLSQAVFDKIGDFRSSLGAEVRVQLPVVNVPFRLIYAYNPNARTGVSDEVPLFFNEKRSVFRFSIGRTF
nr:BamA/TamA family outer membrane protein [Pyrinomonadaceae bacterium]